MQTIIKARHMVLSAPLKQYAEEKLGHAVTRVFDRPATKIDIVLSMLGHLAHRANQECKVTVSMPEGKTVVLSAVDTDMYKAIDLTHHRLLLQVNRERGRLKNFSRIRKYAERERAHIARRSLTVMPELWEQEVHDYEQAALPA